MSSSVADPDPGSDAFFHPWIQDPGCVKSKDPDPGSGMNNPDHISWSLETIFWVKILEFFDADLGSGMEKFGSGIRDGKKSDPGCKNISYRVWLHISRSSHLPKFFALILS